MVHATSTYSTIVVRSVKRAVAIFASRNARAGRALDFLGFEARRRTPSNLGRPFHVLRGDLKINEISPKFAIRLRGADAPQASLLIDCVAGNGTRIIQPRTKMTAGDDGVIRFQIDLDQRTERVEFRLWEGQSQPLFFEAIELRSIAEKSEPG